MLSRILQQLDVPDPQHLHDNWHYGLWSGTEKNELMTPKDAETAEIQCGNNWIFSNRSQENYHVDYVNAAVKGDGSPKNSFKNKFLWQIRFRYIVWNNVRNFQENRTNSFRTTSLSEGMGMGMAGMWYLANILL